MQKIIIVCLSLFCLAHCAPPATSEVEILKSTQDREVDGSWSFGFEGSDGSAREEVGRVIPIDDEKTDLEVTGSYKYTDPETGMMYEVTYTAGKDGFVPIGKHIAESISNAAKAAKDLPPV